MSDEDLIVWADKQPEWARDAMRRHAWSPALEPSNDDKAAIVERVRHASGISAAPHPNYVPLTTEHLNIVDAEGPRAVLCSLGPVKRLNRLAGGQRLSFATDGITLIYGENGSGKSGYCRIAKKICRSLTAEDLLDNVLETNGHQGPAEVLIRYSLEGQVVEQNWIDGTKPPLPIAQISVFDSKNARFYVDKQNRIGFLPTQLALLERHAAHRAEMDTAFKTELAPIQKRLKTPLPAGCTSDGTVEKLLAKLSPAAAGALPTAEEIRELADWNTEDDAKLHALKATLAQDPAALAERCKRAKGVLETYAQHLGSAEDVLSRAAADHLKALYKQVQSTSEAAALAAADRFGAESLELTGQPAWRLM